MSASPEVTRAVAALLDICPRHTVDGRAVPDDYCGDCRSRLRTARLYLLGLIEDVEKSFGL